MEWVERFERKKGNNMSKEEKKAIEYLKGYKYDNEVRQAIDIVLNLIDKQQKQIEELNKENNRQHELICNIHNKNVSKDKIREKMQEYYEKASPYDCDTADYKQSQEIGGFNALRKLLEE